ncbi:MAG TPA: ACP S-malonyltransferase [Polyangiaceae bacterium]|nr:ACP S-malonyltransferase [Polyangiaceae bacterium]
MRAYVFPGQGAQKKGMGRGLFEAFRPLVDQADEVLGYSIERLCLDDPDGLLNQTAYTQPAIYVTSALHYLRELERGAPRPDFLAGHSLGEYNALLAAEAFDFRTGLALVKRRAELMAGADGGGMAAVIGLSERELADALAAHGAADVTIANYNAPRQLVLSGRRDELDRLKAVLGKSKGVKAFIPLRTSGAFHSPHMQAARLAFGEFLRGVAFAELETPVVSNVTAAPYPRGAVASLLAEQLTSPVRWVDSVQHLRRVGVSTFVEIGEGKVLKPLVDQIVAEGPPPPQIVAEGPPPPAAAGGAAGARPGGRAPGADAKADGRTPAAGAPLLGRIFEHCAARPDKTLLAFHDDESVERITAAELVEQVGAFGAALAAAMPPREKAVLFFPHGANYVRALLGCLHANVAAVPTPVTSAAQFEQRGAAVRAIVESSGARYFVCDDTLEPEVARLAGRYGATIVNVARVRPGGGAPPRPADEGDPALVLYTSGSTSRPKGVLLDHATLLLTATAEQWCVSEDSRVVTWLPKYHAFGISFGTLTPLARGALGVASSPEAFVREPASWFELIGRYEATHTGAPNFAFDLCCRSIDERAAGRLSLGSLRSLVCGGDVIDKRLYDRFAARFAPAGLRPDVLTPNFGMSEAGPITLKPAGTLPKHLALSKRALEARRVEPAGPDEAARLVMSCGEPDEATRVLAVDPETGVPCPPGAIGELWVKTPRQARGYLNDAEATERAFNGVLKTTGEGGFLRTGDLGFVAGRDVYIVGREKDVIVVNGKKYDSADLELTLGAALDRHPAVFDRASGVRLPCAAFSYDDDGRERVTVVQEVEGEPPERDCAELSRHVVGVVSEAFQLEVSDVLLVAKGVIPMTGSKKVRRKQCREQFTSGTLPYLWHLNRGQAPPRRESAAAGAAGAGLVDAVRERVFLPVVGEAARGLDAERPFGQLGLDSIQYIRLARKIEAAFGVAFQPDMFYAHPTCRAVAEYVAARGGGGGEARRERWRAYRDERVASLLRDCARGALGVEKAVKLLREGI